MTRDDLKDSMQRSVGEFTPPGRTNYDERTSYAACLEEIKLLVIGCPSLLSYIAYLLLSKANRLYPTLNRMASDVLANITKEARGSIETKEVDDSITTLVSLIHKQDSIVSTAMLMYSTNQSWLGGFRSRLENEKETGLNLTDADRAGLSLLIDATPQTLSGEEVLLSEAFTISMSGTSGSLLYNGVEVNPSPLILKGSFILGSEVTSVSGNTITVGTPVTGTTNKIQYTRHILNTPVVTDLRSRQTVARDIATTFFTLNGSEEIATCLRVFGLTGASRPTASFAQASFDPVVKKVYRNVKRICLKWKHPDIFRDIHTNGFNLVFNTAEFSSKTDRLKESSAAVGAFSDTRGITT